MSKCSVLSPVSTAIPLGEKVQLHLEMPCNIAPIFSTLSEYKVNLRSMSNGPQALMSHIPDI